MIMLRQQSIQIPNNWQPVDPKDLLAGPEIKSAYVSWIETLNLGFPKI